MVIIPKVMEDPAVSYRKKIGKEKGQKYPDDSNQDGHFSSNSFQFKVGKIITQHKESNIIGYME